MGPVWKIYIAEQILGGSGTNASGSGWYRVLHKPLQYNCKHNQVTMIFPPWGTSLPNEHVIGFKTLTCRKVKDLFPWFNIIWTVKMSVCVCVRAFFERITELNTNHKYNQVCICIFYTTAFHQQQCGIPATVKCIQCPITVLWKFLIKEAEKAVF